ncbi:MAG: endolytic transglycosylase MltG [Agromyces sp.]
MTDETPSRRSARAGDTPDATAESAPVIHPEVPAELLNAPGVRFEYVDVPARRRRPWLGWVIAGGLVLAIGGVAVLAQGPIASVIAKFQGPEDFEGTGTSPVTFEIAEGETGEDISRNLVTAGVIKSFDAFYQLLLKENPTFEPGVFQLKLQMSARSALDALLDPASRLQNTVLLTEGQTQEDAFAELERVLGFSRDELEALAANPSQFGLPSEATSLEGFLFPATYTFDPTVTPEQALQTMVDRSFKALDDAGVATADRWSTVVLASLIQKEAGLRDDYYKVARVFLNRLDPDIWPLGLLQSDATVAYGTGNTHRVSTTDAERADASNPYNTYVHPGMVIAPISNPGDLAIDAALHPADGPWLYFVTWNLDTGETIFSTTEAEHNAAVAKWLAWMDEHPEYQ